MSLETYTADGAPLEHWFNALAEIGEAVAGDEPVADLLDRVARTACTLLGYDFCAVFLPDGDRRALTIQGSHGLSPDYIAKVNADRPILLDVRGENEAPTSIAYRTGDVVTLEDIELVPGFTPWGGVAHEQGYRALISVPLRRAGVAIGALNGYRAGPHSFTAAEVSLVTTLATQVAIALGTAQLRAQEQATIRELRRAEEVHALLMATALRGEGIGGAAGALAALLGHPVLIEDVYGEHLATAGWAGTETVTLAQDADDRISTGAVLEAAGHSVAGVVLDGSVVARVHIAAVPKELSRLDIRAIEHAAVVTALEMLRARTAAEVEQRLRGSLVADLLSSDTGAIGEFLDRARRLGWDLSGQQTLITIRWPEPGEQYGRSATDRVLEVTDRFAAGMTPRPLAAVFRGDLVLVVATGSRSFDGAGAAVSIATRLVQTLVAATNIDRAVAAVSAPGTAADLPEYSRTMRGALTLSVDAASTSTVIDMNDITIDHLLLQLDDPGRLRGFAESALGRVIAYDSARSTELVRTARVYLEHDLDRRATAAALHLHPNTVQQRLRRFEELTGLRLSRPRDLLRLTSALTVARIAELG